MTLGTPGGRSQCSMAQQRAVATTVSDGSGLTACGVPTLESSGVSKMLSLQAWQSRQVDVPVRHPVPHRAQLADPPDEAVVQSAGVAPVLRLVHRRDEVVEADGLGKRGDHVGGRGRGEHQAVPLGPERGQALRRERGDQLGERRHRPLACGLDLVLLPAAGDPGSGPHQAHGEEVLAEAVVHRVEEAVPGQRAPLREHPLLDQGTVQHLSRGSAEQRPVEVDEDRALGHGTQPKAVATCFWGALLRRSGPRP